MNTLFTWLHLSDIHFTSLARAGRPLVSDQLRKAIRARRSLGAPDPQAIFVTGDAADRTGKKEDAYAIARGWLLDLAGDLGLSPQDIHIVPGNHDVERTGSHAPEHAFLEALRSGTVRLDDVLQVESSRTVLRSRLAPFIEFARDFAPVEPWLDGLAWKRRIEPCAGLEIRLAGLNTVLLANDSHDIQQLRVGSSQLDFLLAGATANEVVLVLSHHPFDWLADAAPARPAISALAHVHLTGHVHQQHSRRFVTGGGRELVEIAAGAPFGPAAADRYSFNFGALVGHGEARAIRLWPLAWSAPNFDFRLDVDNVPPASRYTEHPLRESAARQAVRLTAPPPVKPRTVSHPVATIAHPDSAPTVGHLAAPRALAAFCPPLAVYVVWHPQHLEGEVLARQLYELLSRGEGVTRTGGMGIPVWFRSAPATSADALPAEIPFEAAQRTAVIVLVDDQMMADRERGWGRYVDAIVEQSVKDSRVHIIPVAIGASAVHFIRRHGISYCKLAELPPSAAWKLLQERVTLELCSFLLSGPGARPARAPRITAFLSHATQDGTDPAATLQRLLPDQSPIQVFFDKVDIASGANIRQAIQDRLGAGADGDAGPEAVVLVAMQTDLYGSRDWCQMEVLAAKENGLPILLVHRIDYGEQRAFPYLGNVPSLSWAAAGSDDTERARTLREHILALALRDRYLRLHLRELCAMYGVDGLELTSPPELLTLSINERGTKPPPIVVYPDPPLGEVEHAVLHHHQPGLVLLTPTQLSGFAARRSAAGTSPGRRALTVGLSVSDSPDLMRLGFGDLHLDDAMREVARHLLAAGHRLAYGGDLRPSGFTRSLKAVAATYAGSRADLPILNFLAGYIWKSAPKAELAELATVGELRKQATPADATAMPAPSNEYLCSRDLTEMRRAMNEAVDARLLLGGSTYRTTRRLPGLVEEAWLAAASNKPMYLLGAFGGCTGEIIRAVQGDTPEMFSMEFQVSHAPRITALLQEYDERLGADEGTRSLSRALEDLQRLGVAGLARNNGLSEEENAVLFSTKDLPTAIALVLKGLQEVGERDAR